jgi:hypothetical protein
MKRERRLTKNGCIGKLWLTQPVILLMLFCTNISVNAYPLSLDWSNFFIPTGLVPKMSATARTTSVTFPSTILRGHNALVINALSGQEFNIGIRHLKLGSYTNTADWELRTRDNTVLETGTLLFDQNDTITYTHDKDEVLYLYVKAGVNAFYLTSSDATIGIVAGSIAKFLGNSSREMYVSVPEKAVEFSLTLYSGGTNENVKVEIYNPNGDLVSQGETSSTQQTVTIIATVGTYDGANWKIKIRPPSNGWLEDHALKLSADAPAVLTLDSQDKFYYAPFGSMGKISLMVDKIMPVLNGGTYGHFDEWMVDAAEAVGFNAYVPKDINGTVTLEDVADWCGTREMKTLYWLRGTSAASLTDSQYNGKRYWPSAGQEPILSPNSDELWDTLTSQITACATSSITHPAIQGVFFDFEDYNVPHAYQHTYLISYDDVIADKYEIARSVTLPSNPADRKAWLEANSLHADFVAFQLSHWRDKVKQLRATIDAINPQFQFLVYPFGDTDTVNRPPFLYGDNAPIASLSTAQAPIILADYQSYPAPYTIIHDAEAEMPKVCSNLARSNTYADEFGTPYFLLGGFDPYCLLNLEFLARAPIATSETAQGYWVFYEGVTSDEHTECMDWFDWANDKIALEDYDASEDTYTSTLPWDTFWDQGSVPDVNCTFSSQNKTFSSCKMRGKFPMVISCQSGTSVSIKLNVLQLGSYTDPLAWELRTLDAIGTRIDRGTVWMDDGTETITFTPQVTGTYVFALAPGLNTVSVAEANAPISFYTGKRIDFLANTTPLYLNVPAGIPSFSLIAQSQGTENVKVSIYSPAGLLVTTDQTSSSYPTKTITVTVGSYGSGAWKVVPGPADTGSFEDYYLTVGTEIPQFLSLSPNDLFQ